MMQTVKFIFGATILFLMAIVLWRFIEPTPTIIVSTEVPVPTKPSTNDQEQTPLEPPVPPASTSSPVACTMEAKMCPDGSFVGRTGPGCEFAACPDAEIVSVTQYCEAEPSQETTCIDLYDPVCAMVQVECITTPCDPVPQTFSNSCYACTDDRVISYTKGACVDGETAPLVRITSPEMNEREEFYLIPISSVHWEADATLVGCDSTFILYGNGNDVVAKKMVLQGDGLQTIEVVNEFAVPVETGESLLEAVVSVSCPQGHVAEGLYEDSVIFSLVSSGGCE